MNDLHYLRTLPSGNSLYVFPFHGYEWQFERVDSSHVVLHDVVKLPEREGTEDYDVWMKLEDLPEDVRGAVVRSQYRLKSRVMTAEGAMSA